MIIVINIIFAAGIVSAVVGLLAGAILADGTTNRGRLSANPAR